MQHFSTLSLTIFLHWEMSLPSNLLTNMYGNSWMRYGVSLRNDQLGNIRLKWSCSWVKVLTFLVKKCKKGVFSIFPFSSELCSPKTCQIRPRFSVQCCLWYPLWRTKPSTFCSFPRPSVLKQHPVFCPDNAQNTLQ